jgi:hypothetical protein
MKLIHFCRAVLMVASLGLAACAEQKPADYTAFRAEAPRSIVIVPIINNSTQVEAPDNFLVTLSQPLAERGYYVFPVNMVKRTMEDDGLSDATLVANANPAKVASLFGADAVLYAKIEQWDTQYLVFSSQTTVQIHYTLKSGKTGATLWDNDVTTVYSPHANGGNPLATLVADAIIAAIQRAHPNYIPAATQANQIAFYTKNKGLLAGPYDPGFGKVE